MKQPQSIRHNSYELRYEKPVIELILLSREDIVTASGSYDENQGAWDSQ